VFSVDLSVFSYLTPVCAAVGDIAEPPCGLVLHSSAALNKNLCVICGSLGTVIKADPFFRITQFKSMSSH